MSSNAVIRASLTAAVVLFTAPGLRPLPAFGGRRFSLDSSILLTIPRYLSRVTLSFGAELSDGF